MNNLISLAESGKINEEANIRDKQSTIINAPAEQVWAILTDIKNWSKWNKEVSKTECSEVSKGTNCSWIYSGESHKTIIRKVILNKILCWTATENGKKSIHLWKLEATDGDQTIVTTEKSLQGFRTMFYSHQKLHNTLLKWLANLKQCAETGSI